MPEFQIVSDFQPTGDQPEAVERKTGVLRIKRLHLEPGVRPSARLAASVSRAMRDFMRFHAARDLVVECSNPPEFGAKVAAAA